MNTGEKFEEHKVESQSEVLKNASAEDVQALRQHVHARAEAAPFGSGFLSGQQSSSSAGPAQGHKRDDDSDGDEDMPEDAGDPAQKGEVQPIKKLKGNIVRLRTAVYKSGQDALTKLKKDMNEVGTALVEAFLSAAVSVVVLAVERLLSLNTLKLSWALIKHS